MSIGRDGEPPSTALTAHEQEVGEADRPTAPPGSELTSWGIVHPSLSKLEHRAQVRAEKLIYRRFATVDPFLMTATVVACFVAAGALHGRSSTLALIGALCFTTMLALTLIGNVPFNVRVVRWDEELGEQDEWRRIRRRWDRIHTAWILLDSTGFILVALAAVTA